MSQPSATPPAAPPPERNRWQFSLATLLWVTILLSVLLAFLGGVLRTQGREASLETMLFRLALIGAPLAILVVVSVARGLLETLRRFWGGGR